MSPAAQSHVLVLATTFPARAGDGTPEFVLTLADAVARGDHRVTALVPRVPGSRAAEQIGGVTVRRFRYFPRRWETVADGAIMANLRARPVSALQVPFLMASFVLASWRLVRQERPDVVHAHWILPAGLVARLLQSATGVPYIITVHGADAYTLRSGLARSLKRTVMRGASAVVPVSEAIGHELESLGDVSPPVPMGVDIVGIRAGVGPRHPEPGRVLFVGRLVEKKGVDVLISATARVPDARLVIAGGGPLLEPLRSQCEDLGVSDRVVFLGHSTRAQVLEELARAQLLVLPSQVGAGGDQDGVPVVLGEAMAAGVPVIASRLGGLAEHVVDGVTGRLVEPGAVDDLAGAVHELLRDPGTAERLAESASAYVERVLDVEVVSDRYRDVLARIPLAADRSRPTVG